MASTSLLSADDLLRVPDPDLPHELWRGVLRIVTPAATKHGAVSSRLLVALGQHVYAHEIGALFTAEAGFLLERDPDTVLCPDVAVVRKERLPAGGVGPGFLEVAPDLTVEILSPSDRRTEVRAKVTEYLRLGVRVVWVIDPQTRTVRVHAYVGDRRDRVTETRLTEHDTLDGGEVVPGWRCPVAALFTDLRR